MENIELYERDNGDWVLDYTGPGGDYRTLFAGPDAEVRAQMYLTWLHSQQGE